MEVYELNQGERFLIETIREFRFLSAYRYEGSGFVVVGREYSVTFTNYSSSRSITIIWQEAQDVNVIFRKKNWRGVTSLDLSKVARFNSPPTSLKTLAELIQSDYMYLVSL